MARGGLPEGLMSNREGVRPTDEGDDRLLPEQASWLWRVYASKKTVLVENIGFRLENFFWRIWSNDRLRKRLSGTQVNILFEIINEGGDLRTTPTSSPRSSKSLSAYYKQARLRTPPTTPPSIETAGERLSSTKDELLPNEEEPGNSSVPLLPSKSFAKVERLNHPAPLSSHPDIDQGSSNPTPASPLTAISKAGRSSADLSSYNSPSTSTGTPTPTSPVAALEETPMTSKENRWTSPATHRRPPILKKEGSSASSRSSRSTRAVITSSGEPKSGHVGEIDGPTAPEDGNDAPSSSKPNSPRRVTSTRFNEEVAISIPKASTSAPRPGGDRMAKLGAETGQRVGKKPSAVVASTGASKTRPTFARQKSSLSGSKNAPSRSSSSPSLANSPKLPSATPTIETRPRRNFQQVTNPSSTGKSRAVSPHPSKQRRRPWPGPLSTEESSEVSGSDEVGPAVELGFTENQSEISASKQPEPQNNLDEIDARAKGIAKNRAPQRSITNLANFARKSSAALPTAASFQASGMMQSAETTLSAGSGKGREAFTNVTAPLKGPAPSAPSRTQSQLTLLLEKKTSRSADKAGKARGSEP